MRRVLMLTLVGWLTAAAAQAQVVRTFAPRFSTNDNGDITLVGNTLMSCSGGGLCPGAQNGTGGTLNNNNFAMAYQDVDADASTFCSTRATLTLPAGATVSWAGLYWSGNSNNVARNQVRFSTPVAGYVTLTASQLDASGTIYQGFVDVTARVQAGGNGSYTAANVQSTTGANQFAGWSLVILYRDPGAPPRNLTVFDGYAQIAPGATVNIAVSGFLSPPAGPVNTHLGVVAGEGDLGLTGDGFQLNGVAVGDAVNPTTNFFNSTVSRFGAHVTTKTPSFVNQLGWDVDLLNLIGALPNGATGATITLNSVGDRYYPGVVVFATDLYAPVIGNGSFLKTVTDLNGGVVAPGDVLEYTLSLSNTGQDAAAAVVARDTIPANASFVAGSMSVMSGANAGAKTDAAGDDVMEYDAVGRRVIARLGVGANAANGGSIAPGAATSIRFRVSVGVAPNGSTVANQGWVSYQGAQIGNAFTSPSDGDAGVPGDQPTTVTVVAGIMSGTVFEDAGYGGGAGRSLASASVAPRPGARVELYDGTGAFVTATTTSAAGTYAFDGYPAGSYTVRVVNSSVTSARPGAVATLVPVQTYRTDGATGSAIAVTDRVGGEIPSRVDAAANTISQTLAVLTTTSTTPQSISPVTLGTVTIAGLDFGFNFDTIVNVNDAGQGSLRAFLIAANTLTNAGLAQAGQIAGVECSIFMISDGAAHPGLRAGLANLLSGGVAVIVPASTLPALTDASTRLDGATQTANVGDTNGGTLGAGGTVGVDALALAAVPRPEVELRGGPGHPIGLDLQAGGLAVASIAVGGFGFSPGSDSSADIRVGVGAANALVDRCVLGSRATSFTDPGPGARSLGDHVRAVGGDGGIVRNSLMGFGSGNGVALAGASDGWQILGCEISANAIGQPRSGIAIESGTNATVRGNWVGGHLAAGIDARTSGGGHTLDNNTITASGTGTAAGNPTPGIRLGGTGNRVDRDVIVANFGAGVLVVPGSSGNVITRNAIHDNGTIPNQAGAGGSGQIGIDLLAAGENENAGATPFVTLNDIGDVDGGANGLPNFPVVQSAVLSNGNITVTGWARPGSVIELFVAAADASGLGEGRTWVLTLAEGSAADVDATTSSYSGLVNGIAQGIDDTNRFRFTLPAPGGIATGTQLTATATVAGNTSEFSGNVTVTTGVSVSGHGYADANHSLDRDAGEVGTGATLYAKLVSAAVPGSALAVTAIDPASGVYGFGFVSAGAYTLVLDDDPLPSDVTPGYPAGWLGTEAPIGSRPLVVAATDVLDQDFGLWHGSLVDGRVARDDGAGGGIPNDGAGQPGESGIAGVRIALANVACAGGVCDSVLTDGAGRYRLWLPFGAVGVVTRVFEVDPAGWLSTGGDAGTTGGSYSRPADATSFTPTSGVSYAGVDFGDLPPNTFVADGLRVAAPGTVVFYPHAYTAASAGTVTFTSAQSPAPALPGWSVELYRDLDCDGAIDPGEPLIAAPLALATGQSMCLVLKHAVPGGAPSGAQETVTLAASYAYVNATPALGASAVVSDLTQVNGGSGALEIVKSVDLPSARPGDLLTYTITYRNTGPAPLNTIVINDATPAYTVFAVAGCATLGAGLTGCAVTTQPAVDGAGALRWTLTGSLTPGASGSVSFRVKVQ